jgi:hypothetical protein
MEMAISYWLFEKVIKSVQLKIAKNTKSNFSELQERSHLKLLCPSGMC